MKGKLIKSNDEWMVKYTTYKTIPGIKGVMGSHSRMPESNYIPIHPDHILYLCPGDDGQTIDFEIIPVCTNCGRDHCDNLSCRGEKDINYAKLINEEKNKKPNKQKKYTNIMSENNIKRMYTEEDLREAIDMARMMSHIGCLEEGEHRIKYSNTEDDIINSLNKND